MPRALKFAPQKQRPALYADFTTEFAINPLTGLLAVVENEDSVGQSIMNLCFTMRRERFNQPLTGSKLLLGLFEMNDEVSLDECREMLIDTVKNDEPRVDQVDFKLERTSDPNSVAITCTYTTRNIPNAQTFSFLLQRIR